MKRAVASTLLVVLAVALLCLGASETLINRTGKAASGVVVTFSESVRISSYDESTFSDQSPSGRGDSFTFSGGTLANGGRFKVTWTPSSATVLSTQWLQEVPAPPSHGPAAALGYPVCGVHIGGAWGVTGTADDFACLPLQSYESLISLNANWVGISISLTISDSMDASVSSCGPDEEIRTFTDQQLRDLVRRLTTYGFHIYFTLAFETLGDGPAGKRVERWQLGDPFAYRAAANVAAENWPWSPSHPQHDQYVAEFFRTYTEQAVHYAELAQEEGVRMFSLGTETDALFRTTVSGPYWIVSYAPQLTEMVRAVRSVFSGSLTYDMLYSRLLPGDWMPNTQAVWGDLGLDVVGISAYFPLLGSAPSSVPSVESLSAAWRDLFEESLDPIRAMYPSKPLIFLELGYTDAPGSSADPARLGLKAKQVSDANGNGLDDGEEEQANILDSLFRTMNESPDTLAGVFLWGHQIATDAQWNAIFAPLYDAAVRGRLAEQVVADWYALWVGEHSLTEAALEADRERARATSAAMDAVTWDSLQTLLSWPDRTECEFAMLDLTTGKDASTLTLDERFGSAGWQVQSVRAGITGSGLAIELIFAPDDGPTEDPLVDYVIAFGASRVQIRSARPAIGLYGPSSSTWWNPFPTYLAVDATSIRCLVPPEALVGIFPPLGSLAPCAVAFHIAYRGDKTHGFVFYPGSAVLAPGP